MQKQKVKIISKSKPLVLIALLLATVITVLACLGRVANQRTAYAATTPSSRNALSLVEINSDFNVMLMRSSAHKTIVYVERLYFDYNPLSSLRLRELDCAVKLTNESNEWAKVGGWVKSEQGVRPGDTSGRLETLYFVEIRQYWEWRTFTNNERWTVEVNDGYNVCEFDFDRGRDGAIYHIDGVFGLPYHRYAQVAEWYDLTNENAALSQGVRDYAAYAASEAMSLNEGEPLNLEPQPYKGRWLNVPVATAKESNESKTVAPMAAKDLDEPTIAEPMLFGLIMFIVVAVVAVTVVCAVAGAVSADKSVPPGMTPEGEIKEIPPEIVEEYEENKPVLTEEERTELDKHKEFSLDNDAPTAQKIVKLKVLDEDGNQQSVYDENGDEVYVNRKTLTVGNSTYAMIDRKAWLLIRYNASDMSLSTTNGAKITINADSKIMNMDGVECLSPISRDDVLNKLAAMGKYTSQINYEKLMFRMDDDNALKVAMGEKTRNTGKSFWATISQAFSNVFGGGESTSRGFLSGFLDVLIMIGVILIGVGAVVLVARLIISLTKKRKEA